MRRAVLTPSLCIPAVTVSFALFMCHGCTPLQSPDDRADGGACAHHRPPSPPATTGHGGALDLKLMVWNVGYGQGSDDDAGRPRDESIGFDLDNTCTGEGQGPSCQEPPWVPERNYQDSVDGIDNAFGRAGFGLGTDAVTVDASLLPTGTPGTGSAWLFRVHHYSGEPDDDQVEVSLYFANGMAARDDGMPGPVWDGQDRFNILPDSLESPEAGANSQPKFVDSQAYVSRGVLVAKFDDALAPWAAGLEPTRLWPVHGMVVAGTLAQNEDGTWELRDAAIGLRLALQDALEWVALSPPFLGSTLPICNNYPTTYETYLLATCSHVDIAYDDPSPSAMCNAISAGTIVQAKQVQLADVVADPLQGPPLCGPISNPCGFGDD